MIQHIVGLWIRHGWQENEENSDLMEGGALGDFSPIIIIVSLTIQMDVS